MKPSIRVFRTLCLALSPFWIPGPSEAGERSFLAGDPLGVERTDTVLVVDLNHDGRDEIVSYNVSGLTIAITSAEREHRTISLDARTNVVASGDVDGDGRVDLLSVTDDTATLWRQRTLVDWTLTESAYESQGIFHIPQSAALTDLDGDGDLDALTSASSGDLRVALYEAEGRFSPVQTSTRADHFSEVDFDADGKYEVLSAKSSRLELLEWDTDEGFREIDSVVLPGSIRSLSKGRFEREGSEGIIAILEDGGLYLISFDAGLLASRVDDLPDVDNSLFSRHFVRVVDLDGDDAADLLIPGDPDDHDGVRALLGSGLGTFPVEFEISLGLDYRDVDMGDVDGDGLPDLVASRSDVRDLVVFYGIGIANFSTTSTTPLPSGSRQIVPLDIDQNGVGDVLIVLSSGYAILRGDGAGGFAPPDEHETTEAIFSDAVSMGVDEEGRYEVVFANQDRSALEVLRISPSGETVRRRTFPLECQPSRLSVGHLNENRHLDVVTTCRRDSRVIVVYDLGTELSTSTSIDLDGLTIAAAILGLSPSGNSYLATSSTSSTTILRLVPDADPETVATVPELNLPTSLRFLELDGRQGIDLIASAIDGLYVVPNVLTGQSEPRKLQDAKSGIHAFEFGDLIGDGQFESLVAQRGLLTLSGPGAWTESLAVGTDPGWGSGLGEKEGSPGVCGLVAGLPGGSGRPGKLGGW
ncbi:MAG: VCBS repeat-containing protein, partial [Planctomycetota bacterium]